MAGAQSSFVWYELMTSDVAAAKAFYPQGASFALLGSK
jgi:predicted enzyme related to lactoylglutathione lyase